MGAPKFFTPSLTVKLGDLFAEEFAKNPKLPLSPKVVDQMMREHLKINPPKGWNFRTNLHLKNEIDSKCRVKLKRLAPTLGARGRLEFRNADGSYLGPHTTHERTPSKKEPPAPTLANLPEPNLGGDEYTRPMGNGSNGNGHHDTRGRVFWGSDARDLLHEAVMAEYVKHPESGLTMDLYKRAMHLALPQDSYRPLVSFKQVGETHERAIKAVRELVAQGLKPPPAPQVLTVREEVPLPVDIEALMDQVPLAVLVGIVARRKAEQEQTEYTARLASYGQPRPAASAPAKLLHTSHASLPPEAIDVAAIEATMPFVQVIGFRPHEHRTLVERFKYIAVRIAPSIDPSTKPDRGLLVKGALYVVNRQNAPDSWRELVKSVTEEHPNLRCTYNDREKCMDHIKSLGEAWAKEHGALFEGWKKTRPL